MRTLKLLDAYAQWPLSNGTALVTLALLCVHSDIQRRPSFLELASLLQEVALDRPAGAIACGNSAGNRGKSVGFAQKAYPTSTNHTPDSSADVHLQEASPNAGYSLHIRWRSSGHQAGRAGSTCG